MGLRRSILGFSQEEVLKLKKTITKEVRGAVKQVELKLDATDLLIINHLADFPNRKNVAKIILDDKIFFWVSYNTIIEELPIIDIKKQALKDRLDKMVDLGILEKIIQSCGSYVNMTFFRIGEAYEQLKYKEEVCSKPHGVCSQLQEGMYSTTGGVCSQLQDNNNIVDNNIVNIKKEDTIVSKKEDIDYDSVLSAWNEVASNVDAISKIRGLNDKRKNCIKNLIKNCKTSVEEIVKVINTIPYADDWVLGKGNRSWTIDFDFLIKNTSNWYVKAIEGGLHKNNLEKFNEIMDYDNTENSKNGNLVIGGIEYK